MKNDMTPTAHVRLTPARGSESRHLWLYAGHVGPLVGEAIAGDLVDVLTPADNSTDVASIILRPKFVSAS